MLEARARALGLVKAGERAFVIRGLPDERPARRAARREDEPSLWDRIAALV